MSTAGAEQVAAALLDEMYRDPVAHGDGDALVRALIHACIGRTIQPDWLAQALIDALRRYTHHQARTLDEAFNVRRPKGYHRASRRLIEREGMMIWLDCVSLRSAGVTVDDQMFELVSALHGVGKTTAKKAYYHHRRRVGASGTPAPTRPRSLRADLRDILNQLRPDLATSAKIKK